MGWPWERWRDLVHLVVTRDPCSVREEGLWPCLSSWSPGTSQGPTWVPARQSQDHVDGVRLTVPSHAQSLRGGGRRSSRLPGDLDKQASCACRAGAQLFLALALTEGGGPRAGPSSPRCVHGVCLCGARGPGLAGPVTCKPRFLPLPLLHLC